MQWSFGITAERTRPYMILGLSTEQMSAACDCVRFWESMGWVPEDRNCAQYPFGSISRSVLAGKPPDLRARIKGVRFACRIASKAFGTYGNGKMRTIWSECVMPFVAKVVLLADNHLHLERGRTTTDLYLLQGDIEKESQELRKRGTRRSTVLRVPEFSNQIRF